MAALAGGDVITLGTVIDTLIFLQQQIPYSGVSLARPICMGSGSSAGGEDTNWAGPEKGKMEGMKWEGRPGDG